MLAILNYHHVAAAPPGTRLRQLYVSPEEFARQLRWLRRVGLAGVTLADGLRRLKAGDAHRCVAITFDDGYLDNATNALPILQEYGFRATCFVVSGRIGSFNAWDEDSVDSSEPLMTTGDLGKWVEAGFEIGSHTCTHANLVNLSKEAVMEELVNSRQTLHALTGSAIAAFCYPYGSYNSETLWCAARAGYQVAVSVRRGRAHRHDNPLALPRLSVNGKKGLLKFLLKASTPYADVGRLWGTQ
jgi:peptidoglycan/xylan/chitin deacetylase (PgdA/CDA1 family)